MRPQIAKPERFRGGWTLVEMILALSLVSTVFLVILPQFRLLQAGWDSKESASEIQQNARVLQEHLNRHLAAARSISAVSGTAQTLGFVEFQDASGQTYRYEVGPDGYVYFGPAGDLSLLAGPVSRFQITGFSLDDFVNPAEEASSIRLIRVDSVIAAAGGRSESYDFSVYLRTEPEPTALRILLVVGNPSSLTVYEQRLYQRLEGWGYEISLLDDHSSQAQIDTAASAADAVFIPSSCGCQNLGSKLALVPIGVIMEHQNCHDDMKISNQEGTTYLAWGVRIVNTAHPITDSYAMNDYVIVLSYLLGDLVRMRGSAAGGLIPLGMRLLQSQVNLAAVEAGGALWGGQPAPARRVVLPWGYSGFNNSWLTEEGWQILHRSIEWAAGRM
ncbi:MAG TPA: type II secretion system protein [Anaerohalosphaeraceae bacterium]|nr:type II secretion system protein [Anaerohalosphaeraceae bacterium]